MHETSQIKLSSLQSKHAMILWRWINDRRIVESSAAYRPISKKEHQRWFRSVRKRGDVVIWGIFLKPTLKLIGYCQLKTIHKIYKTAELQIRLGDPKEHNKGYGTQAIQLLLNYGFKKMRLRKIYLHVLVSNPRAIHIYQKFGFVQEGILRQHACIRGKFVDVLVMGLFKNGYQTT